MKLALVDGQRREAQPNLSGECPGCRRRVVARCGEVRVWHWGHKGTRLCDPWWEHETKWHRDWKNSFPPDQQEIVHPAADGGRHIADVKTVGGWVIEFQHSPITPEERRSREDFYPRLVWVVDGTRRKRDSAQFKTARKDAILVDRTALMCRASSSDSALLREWAGSTVPVLFDFGDETLWWLAVTGISGWAYLHRFARAQFIAWHCGQASATARPFDSFVADTLPKLVAEYDRHVRGRRWITIPVRSLRRGFRL